MEQQLQKQDSERCIQSPREDCPHPKGQERCPKKLQGALLTAVDTEKGASGSTQTCYRVHAFTGTNKQNMRRCPRHTRGHPRASRGNSGALCPAHRGWCHSPCDGPMVGSKGTNLIWDRTTSSGDAHQLPGGGTAKTPQGVWAPRKSLVVLGHSACVPLVLLRLKVRNLLGKAGDLGKGATGCPVCVAHGVPCRKHCHHRK